MIFRSFRYFWKRDEQGRPLLALLCAFTRDALLRRSAEVILPVLEGGSLASQAIEVWIETRYPGRYSLVTAASMSRNLRSTWTQSGHLVGTSSKKRNNAVATPGSVAFALLIGHLLGARGMGLFETDYAKALDCAKDTAIELAEQASLRGWITVKRIGAVIEIKFPNLQTPEEVAWLHEQNQTIAQ